MYRLEIFENKRGIIYSHIFKTPLEAYNYYYNADLFAKCYKYTIKKEV